MRSGLLVGAGGLLAHLLTAAAFRRRTDAMIARLEHASVAEASKPPAPAIIQSFPRRALCENPVPKTVWLSQCGEMRANLRDPWRPFIAEQVISIHEPGFVWLARMQAAPLLYAHILDCYVGGEGLLEVRLFGSLRLARAAGPQASRGELMRYLAELSWAPHAMLHNPHLSWREIDANTIEVSAESTGRPGTGTAGVREWRHNPHRSRRSPACCAWSHNSNPLARVLLRLPRDGWPPHSDPRGGELAVGRRPLRLLARHGNSSQDGVTPAIRWVLVGTTLSIVTLSIILI
jgi:hypothetical protein